MKTWYKKKERRKKRKNERVKIRGGFLSEKREATMITSGMKRHRNFSQLVCMRVCAKDKGSRDQPTKKKEKIVIFFFSFSLYRTFKNVLIKRIAK